MRQRPAVALSNRDEATSHQRNPRIFDMDYRILDLNSENPTQMGRASPIASSVTVKVGALFIALLKKSKKEESDRIAIPLLCYFTLDGSIHRLHRVQKQNLGQNILGI